MSTSEIAGDTSPAPPAGSQNLTGSNSSDEAPLSTQEQELLEAYDRLEQLTFESALLSAQKSLSPGLPPPKADAILDQQIAAAEMEALHAKAAYSIRTKAIETVLITGPTLEAVYAGQRASLPERRLAVQIGRRDEVSLAHARLSADLSSARAALMTAEMQLLQTTQRNAELARTLSHLIEQTRAPAEQDLEDPRVRSQLETLRGDAQQSRLKWRIMKSVVSATVAGSGLNWARDDELRELVLDDEDDDDDDL